MHTFNETFDITKLSFEQLTIGACNLGDAFDDVIAEMKTRPELRRKNAREVRAILLPIIATHYGAPMNEEQTQMLKSKNVKLYEKANKRLQRIVEDLTGKKSKNEDALEVPPEILAAAIKLVKLADEYEAASKLIATAIDTAKTAAKAKAKAK